MQTLDQWDQSQQECLDLLLYLIHESRFRLLERKVATLNPPQAEELLLGEDVPQLREKLKKMEIQLYNSMLSRFKDLAFYIPHCLEDTEKHETLKILFNSDLLMSQLSKIENKEQQAKMLNKAGIEKEEELKFIQVILSDTICYYENNSGGSANERQEASCHSSTFPSKFGSFDENLISSISGALIYFPPAQIVQQNQQNKEETSRGLPKDKTGDINGYSNTYDQSLISETTKDFQHPNGPTYVGDLPVCEDPRYEYRGIRVLYKPRNLPQ